MGDLMTIKNGLLYLLFILSMIRSLSLNIKAVMLGFALMCTEFLPERLQFYDSWELNSNSVDLNKPEVVC